jgi:hypothetical protein
VFDLPDFPVRGSRNKKDMIAEIKLADKSDFAGAYQK